MTSVLPPFLHAHEPRQHDATSRPYTEATLKHSAVPNTAFALWWPGADAETTPDVVILFIPGNPGLLGFYTSFLTALHEKTKAANRSVAILAHSHFGHTPGLSSPVVDYARTSLQDQMLGHIEALDVLSTHYGSRTKYILLGHSVGAWLATQVLKARPNLVSRTLLICPTISHIAYGSSRVQTPNGRKLSWLFKPPFPDIAAWGSLLLRVLPLPVIQRLFSDWPEQQITVLLGLLRSPPTIKAALSMAHDEMQRITELDVDLLRAHSEDTCYFFAQNDDWVGEQRSVVLEAFDGSPDAVRVVHGTNDIPHAFCIKHGEEIASQCFEWL